MLGKYIDKIVGIANRLVNQINMAYLTKHGHLSWSNLVWSIWLSHGHFDGPFKKIVFLDYMYGLTLGENGHFIQNNQPKEPCVFHAPWFLVKMNTLLVNEDILIKLNLLKSCDL